MTFLSGNDYKIHLSSDTGADIPFMEEKTEGVSFVFTGYFRGACNIFLHCILKTGMTLEKLQLHETRCGVRKDNLAI